MEFLIPKPEVDTSDASHLLPPFLHTNTKIKYEHDGQYHMGFLTQMSDGGYCFSYKLHTNKKHPDWSLPLPCLL